MTDYPNPDAPLKELENCLHEFGDKTNAIRNLAR